MQKDGTRFDHGLYSNTIQVSIRYKRKVRKQQRWYFMIDVSNSTGRHRHLYFEFYSLGSLLYLSSIFGFFSFIFLLRRHRHRLKSCSSSSSSDDDNERRQRRQYSIIGIRIRKLTVYSTDVLYILPR